ncbi:putative gustatory receptor 22a [Drosophila guanche]|uniref:Gustatory receptor n=1 Tax=Drosophila guanche TaxID=7266 RepID=A0A3B0JV44_DROGU|nr:putative gustatory receptor 22a [Drosophila guanche]SPP79350.1 blast:Putative gustatory receptor 22a [Drosophila guanche]
MPQQTRRGYRQRVAHFTLKATLYGSWALGLFPFTYDSRTRQLTRSRWLLLYGLVLNLGLMWLSQLPEPEPHKEIKVEVYHRNPVVKQVEGLVEMISMVSTCVMHLRIFWKSKEMATILNELLLLKERHFHHRNLGHCHQFDNYVIQKFCTVLLEVASSLLIYYGVPDTNVVIAKAACVCLAQLGVLLGITHFHLAVIYIYRFVWTINGELLELANQQRRGQRVNTARIQLLLRLYSRLLELNSRLAAIYDIQVTLVMVTLMSANIMIAHVLIIFWNNKHRFSLLDIAMIFPQALIINFYDLWLSIAFCDLAERTGRQTSAILKLYNDGEQMDEELQRSLSDFALFCSHRRLRFRHCGLFYVNYEMGFRMIITNILYSVFLVQFDYMNLQYK